MNGNVLLRSISVCVLIIFPFLISSCITTPSPEPITEPKSKPTITSNTDKLNVHFIKMEYFGDAILIDLGETEILIDGGFPNSGVAEYIKNHVDGPLEAMVATHPHIDHIGGLIEVLQTFDVNEIWLNGDTIPNDHPVPPLIRVFRNFTRAAKSEGVPIHEVRRGQTIDAGILSFYVLHPDILRKIGPGHIDSIINNNCIVLRLRYGDIVFLFMGDAQKEAEANILKAGLRVQADILKVGHHGSDLASSKRFLKSVKPKVAVYMAGQEQPKRGPKKPHQKTIAALEKVGADVYGTTTHGTIIITTDGKTYTIETQK